MKTKIKNDSITSSLIDCFRRDKPPLPSSGCEEKQKEKLVSATIYTSASHLVKIRLKGMFWVASFTLTLYADEEGSFLVKNARPRDAITLGLHSGRGDS